MIKKLRSSLTAKIFLITALLLTICCIVTYSFIVWIIPKTYPEQVDWKQAELFAFEAAQESGRANVEYFPSQAHELQMLADSQFNGNLELHIFDDSDREISLSEFPEQTGKILSDYPSNKRTKEYSFSLTDGSSTYRLIYADNSQAVNQVIEALERIFPYLVIMVLGISLIAALAYSKYITAPIKKINHASRKMAALDFDVKSKTKRTDELGEVSGSLNFLAEKLSTALYDLESANDKLADDFNREKQMEKQRAELFSSVSHELKTPITIVKGQLQGMIGGVGRYKDRDTYLVQSLEAVTRLEMMVQELLMVSRMESPDYTCKKESFDLAELIKQSLTEQEDLFIRREMELVCDLPESLAYTGDKQLLKRTFANLITNALTYSPEGNNIYVNLSKDESGIKFTIENTGVHIDDRDFHQIFDAFFRAEQSRNRQTGGSGLGLYIVKRILELHDVRYDIKNSKNGVLFTVIF